MNVRAYGRFFVVVRQFFPLIVAYLRDRRRYILFGGRREVTSAMRRERARTLLDTLLTLGPTFIKLGQILSTRPDVLPPEYVAEFSKLQDEVPPADWREAEVVIREELGPAEEAFDSFDTDAISGASLGQVYRAELDGEQVAVKVRRPGIEELVEADLKVIKWSLPIIIRFIGEARSFSLETLADEFDTTIHQEIDYGREARMLEEIKANFVGNDDIRIPSVVESHSTPRVLTMEYVSGTKVTDTDELDAMGIDRTGLAERLERIYLQMIVDDGVFHADPHPGNLAVKPDGTLVFYDFGMSGRVEGYVQEKIVEFYIGIANQDIDAILDALVEMGTLSPEADRETMGNVMELAIQDVRGEEVEQYRIQEVVGQVEDTIYEFPLRLPANLALVLRVATVVEGVCVTLEPNFDFISVATDYLVEEGYREEGIKQFFESRGEEVQELAEAAVRTPPKLEQAIDSLNQGELSVHADLDDTDGLFESLANRLIFGALLTAGVISTAMLYSFATTGATVVAAAFSIGVALFLVRSFRSGRSGTRATPEFTRQGLSQQRPTEAEGTGGIEAMAEAGEDTESESESVGAPTGDPEGDITNE
ncbi:ABC1 kinase family protein [Halococcus thailandensis]|uniref:ABC-1 domain-containing protein n=1 Tax=Halococcus thailandensis JCM 13552 TaxID=1227457 RepID=M0N6U3_9EURY|nr:AarF/ABC1/UbiB kinase family protein [Halococcus thailandensis]EMA52405.1 ABC-1 domain-containing protein [Halococcus thailandensis JCM 13552]